MPLHSELDSCEALVAFVKAVPRLADRPHIRIPRVSFRTAGAAHGEGIPRPGIADAGVRTDADINVRKHYIHILERDSRSFVKGGDRKGLDDVIMAEGREMLLALPRPPGLDSISVIMPVVESFSLVEKSTTDFRLWCTIIGVDICDRMHGLLFGPNFGKTKP